MTCVGLLLTLADEGRFISDVACGISDSTFRFPISAGSQGRAGRAGGDRGCQGDEIKGMKRIRDGRRVLVPGAWCRQVQGALGAAAGVISDNVQY